MRKTARELENPIDNILIDIAESNNSYYKSLHFTPNVLTTFSLMFGILAAYLFYKDYQVPAAIVFIISYYFDCADGSFARKYNMETKLGEIYDHVSDISKVLLIVVVMYIKNKEKFMQVLPIFLILIAFSLVNIGCQQKLQKHAEGPIIDSSKYLCVGDPETVIPISRYAGTGTLVILLAIMIVTW